MAAIVGHRGLTSHGPLSAKLVYLGNSIGALFSLLASLPLIDACFESL